MSILRIKNLCKSFGGNHSLIDICFDFPPSGIVAIIGSNGAGKTTLFNILTGFIPPSGGHCWLGEKEITHMSPHRIVQLGISRTFQELRLIQQLSVLDNVLLACPQQSGEHLIPAIFRYGIARQESHNRREAMRQLYLVGLEEKALQCAGNLSYGQQKRLSLACCLATHTPILVLDEPVAGVDPNTITDILALLKQLRENDKLIILIEHDIEAVRQIADILIVMNAGKIVAHGPPEQILKRPEIMEVYLG